MFGKDMMACVLMTASNQTRTYIGPSYPKCFQTMDFFHLSFWNTVCDGGWASCHLE